MDHKADAGSPEDATADRDPETLHDAQLAHGGSMAPSLADDTGHPVAEPPPGTAQE